MHLYGHTHPHVYVFMMLLLLIYIWLHNEISFAINYVHVVASYNLNAMQCLKMKRLIAVKLLVAVVVLSYYSKHQVDAQGNSYIR